jgi:hypothetical protein
LTLLASHAFAPEFTHTTASPDVSLTFTAGTSPVTASLATGTYRMTLAPLASDYLRQLALAIQTALAVRGTYTVIASMSAFGIPSLRIVTAAGVPTGVTFAASVWKRLGYSSATPAITVVSGQIIDITASRSAWNLALLTAATGEYWQPLQAGGSEQTTAGRVYAVAATATSWQRDLGVHYQPTTVAFRASQGAQATALYPDDEYFDALGSTATNREWSVLDVLYTARNALCGVSIGTWQTDRNNSSSRIWRAYVGPGTILSPALKLLKAEWLAYSEWRFALVAPSSAPSEPRS